MSALIMGQHWDKGLPYEVVKATLVPRSQNSSSTHPTAIKRIFDHQTQ
jgi:hypothetical protein